MPNLLQQEPSFQISVPRYGLIDAWEVTPGSPAYLFTHMGSRAERTFLVRWKDRDAFVKGMLGFCGIENVAGESPKTATSTYVFRHPPHALPDTLRPNVTELKPEVYPVWLYATQVTSVEGLEPTGVNEPSTSDLLTQRFGGVPEYKWAQIKVLYEGLTYKVLDDQDHFANSRWLQADTINGIPQTDPDQPYEWYLERYVTRTVKPSAEYLATGKGKYQYVDSSRTPFLEAGRAILQASLEIVYHWHQVPFVPRGAREHIGKVNRDYFDPEHESHFKRDGNEVFGFPPGTLLYSSCEVRPYRTGTGSFVQDVTYRMKYLELPAVDSQDLPVRGRGHNYFIKWDTLSEKLRYFKVTSNGLEDSLGDPFSTPPAPPSTGRPVYEYADFRDLFSLYLRPPQAVTP